MQLAIRSTKAAKTFLHLVLAAVLAFVFLGAASPTAQAAPESYGLIADTHFGCPGTQWRTDAKAALRWTLQSKDLKAIAVAGDVTDRGDAASYKDWVDTYNLVVNQQQIRDVKRIQAMGDHDTGKNNLYVGVNKALTVKNGRNNFVSINGGAETSFMQFSKANIITFGGIRANGYKGIAAYSRTVLFLR